jgi:hypothetical protein
VPPGVGNQRDGGVDDGKNEREARQRRQELDVTQPLPDCEFEKPEAENQPAGK